MESWQVIQQTERQGRQPEVRRESEMGTDSAAQTQVQAQSTAGQPGAALSNGTVPARVLVAQWPHAWQCWFQCSCTERRDQGCPGSPFQHSHPQAGRQGSLYEQGPGASRQARAVQHDRSPAASSLNQDTHEHTQFLRELSLDPHHRFCSAALLTEG